MRNRTVFTCLIMLIFVASLSWVACGPSTEVPPTGEPADDVATGEDVVPTEEISVEPEPTEQAEPVPTATEANADTEETESSEPRILRVRMYTDIANLDPARVTTSQDIVLANMIFNGLVRYAPNSYEIENQLVDSYEISEDGLEISFKLKEGVMWHRGYGELTTEDVKFSYERFSDPDLGSRVGEPFAPMERVEIIDQYRGKIILKEPYPSLWTTILPMCSGNIISKKQVEEVGLEDYAVDVVGTGPYMMEEWIPNEIVILKRNPEYFGETPFWDEIHLFPVAEDSAAEMALEAGELDLAQISIEAVDRFEQDDRFEVSILPSLSYQWLGMNVENPALQDINVRQAIRYGVDVPSMLMTAYMGLVDPAKSLVPEGMLGHWEDVPLYQRDVDKAKEYLAQAGLDSLDIELATLNKAMWRTWAEIIKENLAEVGINVTINAMESSTYWGIGEGDKGVDVQLFLMGFLMDPDPSSGTLWFVCDQVGEWNWMRWCDPEYDRLHEEGLRAVDAEERNEIYIQMEKLFDAAAHTVWIARPPKVYAFRNGVNLATTPHAFLQLEFVSGTD